MAVIDDLWLAALTKDEDDAGSRNPFNLTINMDGEDVFEQDFVLAWRAPGHGRPGLGQGQAGLEESPPLSVPFESNALTDSSIRLGIRGENAWGPQHVLVLGRTQPAFDPARFIALGMETDLGNWLSANSSEGHLSMPIRLVGAGSANTLIERVLLLIYTDAGRDVETDNSIQLQITAGGAIALQHKVTADLNQYVAHWYLLDVENPFTRGDVVSNGGIRLSILGTNAWLPKTVFVLGLNTASGRPNEVVTLVAIPEWGLGWLSTDPQEGNPSVDLPLSI